MEALGVTIFPCSEKIYRRVAEIWNIFNLCGVILNFVLNMSYDKIKFNTKYKKGAAFGLLKVEESSYAASGGAAVSQTVL